MNRQSARVTMVVLGLLDLLSFYRVHNLALYTLHHLDFNSSIPLLKFLLTVSLVASALFLLLGKRTGFIIYYFQFPFKLAFLILTFGFLLSLLGLTNPMAYKILLGFVIGLETVRLFLTIWMHRSFA